MNHKYQPLKNRRILSTRPLAQGQALHENIQQLGGVSYLLPIMDIEPKPFTFAVEKKCLQYTPIDDVIFTSRNAVLHSRDVWSFLKTQMQSSTRFWAIGEGTQDQLKEEGINEVLIPEEQFNSEGLLQCPQLQQVISRNIVIISGEGGRDTLEQILTQRGAKVLKLAVYQRVIAKTWLATQVSFLEEKQIDLIVLTSNEALKHFFAHWLSLTFQKEQSSITEKNSKGEFLQKLPLLVISDTMASFARESGFKGPLIQAKNATTDSLIQAILTWSKSTQ